MDETDEPHVELYPNIKIVYQECMVKKKKVCGEVAYWVNGNYGLGFNY